MISLMSPIVLEVARFLIRFVFAGGLLGVLEKENR